MKIREIQRPKSGLALPGKVETSPLPKDVSNTPQFAKVSNSAVEQAMLAARAAGAPEPVRREQVDKETHFDAIRRHREQKADQLRARSGRETPGPDRTRQPGGDEEEEAAEAHARTFIPPVRSSTPLQEKLRASTATPPLRAEAKVRVSSELGAEWIRQDFPSHNLSYAPGKDIFCRIIDIPVMAKLSAAVKSKSFTMFLDALDPCISMDIRELTPSDLTFFMYWLRLESFPKIAMAFPWVSKYGDELETKVNRTDLEIKEIEITAEEYAEYVAQGYRLPTVRDMELLEDTGLSEEDRFRLELCQYVQGDEEFNPETYVSSKLEALTAKGAMAYIEVQEFAKKITHGVVESAEVTNHKFKPETAIAHFRKTANDLLNLIAIADKNNEVEGNEAALISIGARIKDLQDTADTMQKDLEEGRPIVPEKEVIAITINAMTFFPTV